MRFIRSNLRGLARLALLALAVQLAVTFGHVHLDGLKGAAAQATQMAAADQAAAPVTKVHSKGSQSRGAADFDCPICALIQLASTSAPSVAPPLPVPAMLGETIVYDRAAPDVATPPTFAFQARGPPVV